MKVKIEFDIDNAAYRYDDDGCGDDQSINPEAVADTIRQVAGQIGAGYMRDAIIDANGNVVGKFTII